MTRRFELGPIIVLAAAVLLLVSLFLDWYGGLTAWEVFELVDIVLAALALAAAAAALAAIAPDVVPADRRWLPWLVAAAVVVIAVSIINPPPAAAGRDVDTGAWVAFGASLGMLVGAVLSLSRVSFSVAVEGRELRQRVAAVDERQPTTETAAVMGTRRGRTPTETTQAIERKPGADGT